MSNLYYSGTCQLVNVHADVVNPGDGITYQNDPSTSPQNPVGIITRFRGNLFRYVLVNDTTGTPVAGAPAYFISGGLVPSTNTFSVSTDVASNEGTANVLAGVFLSTPTAGNYTWVQIGGVSVVPLVLDGGAAGDKVTAQSTATFTHIAAGTSANYQVYGVLLEAQGATVSGCAKCLLYPVMVW